MMPKHCFLGFLVSFFLTGGEGIPPAHDSLKPQRVQFRSRNFHNVLHWQPGRTLTGNSSTYFVQYKMYGQRQWQNKEDCWGIQELFCDLTNETSDLQEPYYGRVRMASAGSYSDWSVTRRFIPWWERPTGKHSSWTAQHFTNKEKEQISKFGVQVLLNSHHFHATGKSKNLKIDPPVINITQINGSSWVVLHTPNLPHKDEKGKNLSKENDYSLLYRVFMINNSLKKEQQVYEGARGVAEIEALTPHSGYCVVAEIYLPLLDRSSQRSEERCVGTP